MAVKGRLILNYNYFKKIMSNSYVTLKVTQSYTFLFLFGFENPKLCKGGGVRKNGDKTVTVTAQNR